MSPRRARPRDDAGLRAVPAAVRRRLARLSLRDRVTLATAAVLAGGLVLLSAATLLLLSVQLDNDVASTLRERADAAQATVVRAGGRTVARTPSEGTVDEQGWVFDDAGRVLRSPADASAEVDGAAHALARVSEPAERDVGEGVRLRAEPVRAGGRLVGTVVVAVSLRPYDRTEHIAFVSTAVLDLFIVAFGALLARRAVGKALEPVADMTAQAAEWSEHDLDRRFDLGPPRDELTALSATLDALLERIASSLHREQRFSAEMAHELRTPLSGVRGEAELALLDPATPADVRAGLEQILRGTDRMQGVIEALLAAARGEGGGGVVDAREAAREAVAAAAPAAAQAGVAVAVEQTGGGSGAGGAAGEGDTAWAGGGGARGGGAARAGGGAAGRGAPLRVGAERQLVVQALAPLLDNAVRHARGRVTVGLARDGAAVVLTVSDDGEGFAAADVEAAFAPGASGSGGAGLGLPLARRLARSAGGDVTARAAGPGEGGLVVLRLPAVG
jgi:two-component system, OmpR family, sensor kinase